MDRKELEEKAREHYYKVGMKGVEKAVNRLQLYVKGFIAGFRFRDETDKTLQPVLRRPDLNGVLFTKKFELFYSGWIKGKTSLKKSDLQDLWIAACLSTKAEDINLIAEN